MRRLADTVAEPARHKYNKTKYVDRILLALALEPLIQAKARKNKVEIGAISAVKGNDIRWHGGDNKNTDSDGIHRVLLESIKPDEDTENMDSDSDGPFGLPISVSFDDLTDIFIYRHSPRSTKIQR